METRSQAKRIKLKSEANIEEVEADIDEEVSYDILEWFPVLVCQNVFKYLDGEDVIQASRVGKEWYKFTGESQQAKKLKLVVRESVTRDAVKVLRNSKRRYQNIEFRHSSSEEMRLILPFFVKRSWKSVKLYLCETDSVVWMRMLRTIEPTVEELSITEVECSDELTSTDPNWTFPCLKHLHGEIDNSYHIHHFVRCTSLVKLHWFYGHSYTLDMHRTCMIVVCNNYNLKDLELSGDDEMFEHMFQFTFKFKLKNLNIEFVNDDAPEMLSTFLATQAQTLESLEVDTEVNQAQMELIFSMPRLTTLRIGYFINSEQALSVNTMITSLKIKKSFRSMTQIGFEALIRALPNLKHFKCLQINQEEFLFMARQVPNLEYFKAIHFNVTHFSDIDIFPNIKKFKIGTLNGVHRDLIGSSNFAKMIKKYIGNVHEDRTSDSN